MVVKGVTWVHNAKSGHIVLKGSNWIHNDKIRSDHLEKNNLGTQCKNQVIWSWKDVCPLRQGWATARPQLPLLTHASMLAMQTSMLTQHKPPHLYIPSYCILVPDTAQTIKAEPTPWTQLFFICTETWWQRWTSSSPDRGIRSAAEREEEQLQQWSSSSPNRHTRLVAERGRTGDPALPPTDTLDQRQKEARPVTQLFPWQTH